MNVAENIFESFLSIIKKMPIDYEIIEKSTILNYFATTTATFHSTNLFKIMIEIIAHLDKSQDILLSTLISGCPYPDINVELVDLFENYAYDTKNTTYDLYRPNVIPLLVKLVENSEFEDRIFSRIYEMCSNNASSAYKCFSNNILSQLLERLSKSVSFKAVNLFSSIASQFFSPIVMRDIIKTLRNTDNDSLRITLANCLLDFVSRSQKSPVSSFFHFSHGNLIKPANTDLPLPINVCFCFRFGKIHNNIYRTMFTLVNNNNQVKLCLSENNELVVELRIKNKRAKVVIEQVKKFKWHSLYFNLKQNFYELVIDKNTYSKEFPFPKIDSNCTISFGGVENEYFVGEIGPIFILKTEKISTAIEQAQESYFSNVLPTSCLYGYLPSNLRDGLIMEVVKGDVETTCEAIPFVGSFVDVIKFDSIFPLTLPLMLLDAGKQGNLYLRSLFGFTVAMITKDEKMEKFFRDSGGFRVFSSILKHTPNSLTYDIVHDIVSLYKNVSLESKQDLVRYLILNYDVWMGKDVEFQRSLYGEILPQLLDQNDDFKLIPPEELLVTTINSCYDDNVGSYSEDNFQKLLTPESEDLFFIPLRWHIFVKYFELNPNTICFTLLYLVSFYHFDDNVRNYARESFTSLLKHQKANFSDDVYPIDTLINELRTSKLSNIDKSLADMSLIIMNNIEYNKMEYFDLISTMIDAQNYKIYEHMSYILFMSDQMHFAPFLIIYLSCLKFEDEKFQDQCDNILEAFNNEYIVKIITQHYHIFSYLASFCVKYDLSSEKTAEILDKMLPYSIKNDYKQFFEILGKEKMDKILSKLSADYYELGFYCAYIHYDDFKDEQLQMLALDICLRTVKSKPSYVVMFGTKKVHPFIIFANIAGHILQIHPERKEMTDKLYKSLMMIVPINIHLDYANMIYNNCQPNLFDVKYDYNKLIEELNEKVDERIKNEKEKCTKMLDEFEKNAKNDKLRTSKLFMSFMRSIESDGGPWSSQICNYWRSSTRVDTKGQIVFYRRNTNFIDHKNALNKKENDDDSIETVKKFVLNFDKEIRKSISVFQATCRRISGFYSGYLHLLEDSICFDGVFSADSFGNSRGIEKKRPFFKQISLSEISFIFRRFLTHEDCGIEVYSDGNRAYLFYFANTEVRNEFLNVLSDKLPKKNLPKNNLFRFFVKGSNDIPVQNVDADELLTRSKIAKHWANGKITNYEYLYLLNLLGGRSFNDVSQYPIYPWIISDYKSPKFDISNPKFFRDLSKPIGALNPDRFAELVKDKEFIDDPNEICLYRSNMSNPSSVCGFLVREEPFTTLHIRLQDGFFDKADRLFFSIESSWNSVNTRNSDYRELIPQFFCSPRFLKNVNKFSFGKRSNGIVIDDVELPKWSSSPYDFVDKNMIALESNYVNQHLNEWVDIVFGVNQRCENVEFHPFAYHECLIGVTNEDDLILRKNHCANFGSMPTKIFKTKSIKKSISLPPKLPEPNLLSPVIFMKDGFCLSEDGFFTKLSRKMHKVKFNYKFTKDLIYAVATNPATLFVATKNSPVVTGFQFSHPSNPVKLSNSSSYIVCMSASSNKLVVCGSDCFVYLWSVTTFDLLSTLQLHSSRIVNVSANDSLASFASIDVSHNVFVVSLTDKHVISSFIAKHQEDTKFHKICLTANSRIIISCENESRNASVCVYDICGSLISEMIYGCGIDGIHTMMLSNGYNLNLVSLGANRIEPIGEKISGMEWLSNEEAKKMTEDLDTRLVCLRAKERALWYANRSGMLSRVAICADYK